MRLGLVSDAHCNVASFERALDELEPDVDEVLLLGDLIHEYRFSNEIVGRALDEGLRYVLGNHELGFLRNPAANGRDGVDQSLVGKLRDVPLRIDLDIDGKHIVMVHASPFPPFNDYLFAGSPLLKQCEHLDADILLLGHTHVPMVQRHYGTLVVNPGSIGESRDHETAAAVSYAILDTATEEVEVRRFPNPAYGIEGPTESSHHTAA
ncbi:MAG TPA: YfcE family phosphodiesterase [Amycolatopsis sp.]|nr:YfcE family phosphodiesterase [Amycolatopsis sp.]